MSGGKGGSTTRTEVPQYIQDATQNNLGAAQRIAQMGYVPYYGPDVAGSNPQMQASWQAANGAARAFGMATGAPQNLQGRDFGGGLNGFSSGNGYEAALRELAARRPQQFQQMQRLFGQPQAPAQQMPAPQPAVQQARNPGVDRRLGYGSDR